MPDPQKPFAMKMSKCKLLSLGVICYAVIDGQYTLVIFILQILTFGFGYCHLQLSMWPIQFTCYSH